MAANRPLPEALETLAERVTDAVSGLLPPGGQADLKARIDGVVESLLTRLDLVPREEYERALSTVSRLESRLTLLEGRLAALERRSTEG